MNMNKVPTLFHISRISQKYFLQLHSHFHSSKLTNFHRGLYSQIKKNGNEQVIKDGDDDATMFIVITATHNTTLLSSLSLLTIFITLLSLVNVWDRG